MKRSRRNKVSGAAPPDRDDATDRASRPPPRPLPQYDVKTEISSSPVPEVERTIEDPPLDEEQSVSSGIWASSPGRGQDDSATLEDAFALPGNVEQQHTLPDVGLSARVQLRAEAEARDRQQGDDANAEEQHEAEDDPWSYFPPTVADPSASGAAPQQERRARAEKSSPFGDEELATEVLDPPSEQDAQRAARAQLQTEVLDVADGGEASASAAQVETKVARSEPARPGPSSRGRRVPLPKALAAERVPSAALRTDGIPFGPYWLLRHLKSGGMADVYEAVSQSPSGDARPLALKRIQLPLTESDDFVRMFMDEAKIAVLLNHPSIVQFFEFGHVGEQYYIAMEYVHGRDFDSVLKLTRKGGSRVPVGIALYVMLQVLDALDYAHNKRDANGLGLGIVHRDVSPANVLCGFDGQVKLTDFGIARAAVKIVATQPGILLGKLGYMSPEQLKSGRVDHRADIFSAGIVLWEALAGRRLFHADNDAATMNNVVHAEIPPLRSLRQDVPPALEAAVAEALERDPRRRPARASELGARLRQVLKQLNVSKPENDFIVFMAALFEGEPAGEPIFKR